jgi:lipopolysaccharide export LptBFGC system permease protein LptF
VVIPKPLLVTVIILLSLTVGYLRDRKKRLVALVILGLILAYYVTVTQNV